MGDNSAEKDRLLARRDEIDAQLVRVNENLQTPLDANSDEQAIQIEQEEVAISMEHNLRVELTSIEEKLAGLG